MDVYALLVFARQNLEFLSSNMLGNFFLMEAIHKPNKTGEPTGKKSLQDLSDQ